MATPKYLGRDAELMTAGADAEGRPLQQWRVVRALLAHVGAAFERFGGEPWSQHGWNQGGGQYGGYSWPASSDCLRHWTPNGQCYYSDMSHWEGCTAAVLKPRQFAAQCLSSMHVAEQARRRAEENAKQGTTYTLSAQNVDAQDPSVSWGTHLNVSVDPGLWSDLLVDHRRPARLGFVASGLAAAAAWFGAGYLLPLRDGSTIFSLSARAHHLGRVISESTTVAFQRGLLNTRHEPHGTAAERLHLIGFDFNLASAAPMASLVQCLLAAAEETSCALLQLYEPVRALRTWSWGIDLASRTLPAEAMLADGRSLTLPVYLRELASALLQMVESGLIGEDVAPEAADLLPVIIDMTHYAEEGSLEKLARHSDWAALLLVLLGMCEEPGVELGDPATVLTAQDYANTDPARGIFWKLWEQGLVDPLIAAADIEACLKDGPEDTRGWARGRMIQKFHDWIAGIDWSYVELRRSATRWAPRLRIAMPRLDSLARAQFEPILAAAQNVEDLERLFQRQPGATASDCDPVWEIASQLATDDPQLLLGSGARQRFDSD
jgi:proteasome accessory factor A